MIIDIWRVIANKLGYFPRTSTRPTKYGINCFMLDRKAMLTTINEV